MIRVVMVDDNACTVWGVKHLIEGQQHAMEFSAALPRSAQLVARLQELNPDVVLLGMDVEDEHSLEVIRGIREGCSARIIVFTGVPGAVAHEKFILAGAHGLVLKSEPVEIVLRAIQTVHAGELWLKRQMAANVITMMAAAYQQTSQAEQSSQFTPSESRVIAAAVRYRGAPNKVIADVLHMSPNTFRNHLSAIYNKLGIHRRLDLVLYGIKHGMADATGQPLEGSPRRGEHASSGVGAAGARVQEVTCAVQDAHERPVEDLRREASVQRTRDLAARGAALQAALGSRAEAQPAPLTSVRHVKGSLSGTAAPGTTRR